MISVFDTLFERYVMRVLPGLILSIFALLIVITVSCSLSEEGPEVQIVVGEASLQRNGKVQPLTAGLKLRLWDSLTVAQGSKIKITAGPGAVYVNERSGLQLTRTAGAEKLAVVVYRGEVHFVMRDGADAVCRVGDAFISIRNADAALNVAQTGETAQIAVLKGEVFISRSGEETRVASCTKAVIESAGSPQKEVIQTDELERLKGWVGKSAIEKAVAASAGCRPQYAAAAPRTPAGDMATATVSVFVEESPAPRRFFRSKSQPQPQYAALQQTDTVTSVIEAPPKPSEPAVKTAEPVPAAAKPSAPVKAPKITIDYLRGPRQAFAGQEIVFKVNISSGAANEFVWRFKLGDEVIEKRSSEPQVSVKLEKTGEYIVICEVTGEKGGHVSQQIAVKIVNSPVIVDAGGPYKAFVNTPVKFKGSAESRFSNIVLYEWYASDSPTPDFSSATPAAFNHVFTKAGKHQLVLSARTANGAMGSDTVTVDVSTQAPVANAGEDLVSRPGRRVTLRGTGTVPGGGDIVKYEWDFDGKGTFEWSSAVNGNVRLVFDKYSTPVLRVTNSLGVSATDTMRVVICPDGMVTAENGKFCIDEYQWPNKRGVIPHTSMSWHEAAQACESVGKRLCSSEEWQRACRNDRTQKQAGRNVFPYGRDFDVNRCNTLGNFKTKNRLSPSGAYHDCAGSLSVFDMSGNVSEWVNSGDGAGAPAYGGFYQSGESDSNCGSYVTLDKNRKYFYVGFRCCK